MSGKRSCPSLRNHRPGIACVTCEPNPLTLESIQQRALEIWINPSADGRHYSSEGQAYADRAFLIDLIDIINFQHKESNS